MFFSSAMRSVFSRAMLPLASAVHGGVGDPPEEPPDHPSLPTKSPLTYGRVYLELPRVTSCKTPDINTKIAKPWGLQPVQNSKVFKATYKEGREALRYVLVGLTFLQGHQY